MHITRTHPTPTHTKLVIKADESEIKKAKDYALQKLAPQVKVPGFREGKVPLNLIEKNINPNILQTEVIEEAINRIYTGVLRKENLRPVTNPDVSITKFVPFTDLEFEVNVPTIGKISLADYKKIRLPKQPVKVEAKDINGVVESLRQRVAEYTIVERPAKSGDRVTLDFKGTDVKGEPVQGADGKEYPLVLGSNSFIPGFEDNVIGAKAGEEKAFDVTFPKDYGVKALQNKKVTFTITVHKIEETKLPKIDDDFAAAIGPFKDVLSLKEDIKKQLIVEREREAQSAYENELLEKIAGKSTIEIPQLLIDEQIERIEQEEKQNLLYRGMTWEEHLKEEGVTEDEHKEQKRPAAEQRVKVGIILSEIAENEAITVTPEELEIRMQILRAQYQDPQAQAELTKPEAARDITSRILTEKTLEKLIGYASSK